MKVFLTLILLSFCSFFLGGVFVSKANFEERIKDLFGEKGYYNFSWTSTNDVLGNEDEGQIPLKDIANLNLKVDMGEVRILPQTEKIQALVPRGRCLRCQWI